jgi:hypothetical protein
MHTCTLQQQHASFKSLCVVEKPPQETELQSHCCDWCGSIVPAAAGPPPRGWQPLPVKRPEMLGMPWPAACAQTGLTQYEGLLSAPA